VGGVGGAVKCVTLCVAPRMLEAAELKPPVAPTTASIVSVTAAARPSLVRVRTGCTGRGLTRAAIDLTKRADAWGLAALSSASTFGSRRFLQLLSQFFSPLL
jgi:hypothetical protein